MQKRYHIPLIHVIKINQAFIKTLQIHTKQIILNSIIEIHALSLDSLELDTCGDIYCFASHCQQVSPYHAQDYPPTVLGHGKTPELGLSATLSN